MNKTEDKKQLEFKIEFENDRMVDITYRATGLSIIEKLGAARFLQLQTDLEAIKQIEKPVSREERKLE